jgi:ABC-type multidrug transport system fused ATPase/permease subunit
VSDPPSTPEPPAESASEPERPPEPAAAPAYPLQLEIDRQEEYTRLLPLVKWLLAIPHYIVLTLLGIAAFVVMVISFFAVLITGRYPRGLFDFVAGVYRWGWRVGAYVSLMVDPYPPFSLQDDPSYPARYLISYPEHVDRWRPLVHWLLIIPYHLVASILAFLTLVMAVFAFFTILFTKRFPEGIFEIARVGLRWTARSNAYHFWLTTKYPPWVWG